MLLRCSDPQHDVGKQYKMRVLRFGSLCSGVDSYTSGFPDLSLVTMSPLMVWGSRSACICVFWNRSLDKGKSSST